MLFRPLLLRCRRVVSLPPAVGLLLERLLGQVREVHEDRYGRREAHAQYHPLGVPIVREQKATNFRGSKKRSSAQQLDSGDQRGKGRDTFLLLSRAALS